MSRVRLTNVVAVALLFSGCLANQVIPMTQIPASRQLKPRATINLPGIDPTKPSGIRWVDDDKRVAAIVSANVLHLVDVEAGTLRVTLPMTEEVAEVRLGKDGFLYTVSQYVSNFGPGEPTVIRSFDLSTHRERWNARLTPPKQVAAPSNQAQIGVDPLAVAFPEISLSQDRTTVTLVAADLNAGHSTMLVRLKASDGSVLSLQRYDFRDRLEDGRQILIDNSGHELHVYDRDWTIQHKLGLGSWNVNGIRDAYAFGRAIDVIDLEAFLQRFGKSLNCQLTWGNRLLRARIDGTTLSLSHWNNEQSGQLIQIDLKTGKATSPPGFPSTSFAFACPNCSHMPAFRDSTNTWGDRLLEGFVEWKPDGSWTVSPLDPTLAASKIALPRRWESDGDPFGYRARTVPGAFNDGCAKQSDRLYQRIETHQDLNGDTYFCTEKPVVLYRMRGADRRVEKVADLGATDQDIFRGLTHGCAFVGPFAMRRGKHLHVVDIRNGRPVFTSDGYAYTETWRELPTGQVVISTAAEDDSLSTFIISPSDSRIVTGEKTDAKRTNSGSPFLLNGATREAYWFVEPRGEQDLVLTLRALTSGKVVSELALSYYRKEGGSWMIDDRAGRTLLLYRDHQGAFNVYDLGAAASSEPIRPTAEPPSQPVPPSGEPPSAAVPSPG